MAAENDAGGGLSKMGQVKKVVLAYSGGLDTNGYKNPMGPRW